MSYLVLNEKKEKGQKIQTMINKALHRKLIIEEQKPLNKSGAPDV
jgi:hypothetical protein